MSRTLNAARHWSRPSIRAGFTLVELLVVIGIIALLISILLPALSKARENANQVKCSAQQRQILQGMLLHANDHRGYMPMAALVWNSSGTTDPAGMNDPRRQKYEYWGTNGFYRMTSIAAGVGKYLGQDMDFTSLQSIQKSMNEGVVRKIFNCPSDKTGGRYGHTVASLNGDSGGAHWSSYAFNEAALGWADPSGGGGVRGHSRLRGNTAMFPHSARVMLLADANPRANLPYVEDNPDSWMLFNEGDVNATMGDWYRGVLGMGGKAAADPKLCDKNRHHGRIVVGCADGHVENLPLDAGILDKISISVDFPTIR